MEGRRNTSPHGARGTRSSRGAGILLSPTRSPAPPRDLPTRAGAIPPAKANSAVARPVAALWARPSAATASSHRTRLRRKRCRERSAERPHCAGASACAHSRARMRAHAGPRAACVTRAGDNGRRAPRPSARTRGSRRVRDGSPPTSSRAQAPLCRLPPPPGAGGRAGSSSGRHGTRRARSLAVTGPGIQARSDGFVVREHRAARAPSREPGYRAELSAA